MIKPDFIIIGAAKSGTSSLFDYLRQHPEVFMPDRKEFHYFSYEEYVSHLEGPGDRANIEYACGNKQDYYDAFSAGSGFHAVGEASPSYFQYPAVPERIYNELGPVKIIVMLREPVSRAFSNYKHMKRLGRETLSFNDALLAERSRKERGWTEFWLYGEGGMYSEMLSRYINQFGRDNIHVIIYEEFCRDLLKSVRGVYQFLGVDTQFKPDVRVIHNRSIQYHYPFFQRVLERLVEVESLHWRVKKILNQVGEKNIVSTAPNGEGVKLLRERSSVDYKSLVEVLGRKIDWKD